MRPMTGLLALGLLAAAAPAPTPQAWLQSRMDRVAGAAGLGGVRAVLTEDAGLDLDGRGAAVGVPRAAVAAAPSAAAVDGVLAMLLAYRKERAARGGASAGEAAALAALVALTGGVSDPGEGKGSTFIPLGGGSRDRAGESGRGKASRGVRWAEAAGVCTAALAGYLRTLAHRPVDEGMAMPARRLLADMGALAYPSAQGCPAGDDAGLATVKAQLAAARP